MDQAGRRFNSPNRAPSVVRPFAGQGQMYAKIAPRIAASIFSDLSECHAGSHHTGGRDRPVIQRPEGRGIHGAAHSQVIRMNNQELRVWRKTKKMKGGCQSDSPRSRDFANNYRSPMIVSRSNNVKSARRGLAGRQLSNLRDTQH